MVSVGAASSFEAGGQYPDIVAAKRVALVLTLERKVLGILGGRETVVMKGD